MKSICTVAPPGTVWSPPSRGAWIEIPMPRAGRLASMVAPLAGGVD